MVHPTFTIRYMFEFRVYSPTLKTTFFYGREPSFEERVKLFVCGAGFIGICRSGRGRPRPFG